MQRDTNRLGWKRRKFVLPESHLNLYSWKLRSSEDRKWGTEKWYHIALSQRKMSSTKFENGIVSISFLLCFFSINMLKWHRRTAILLSLLKCNFRDRRAKEIFAEETKHGALFQTETKPGPQRYHIAPPLLSRTHTHSLSPAHTHSVSPQFCSNDWCLAEMKHWGTKSV